MEDVAGFPTGLKDDNGACTILFLARSSALCMYHQFHINLGESDLTTYFI